MRGRRAWPARCPAPGARLTTSKGDLALAKVCAGWPKARQEMKACLTRWQHAGFDFNPRSASGFTMPVPGGPTGEELAEMVALATRAGKVKALGISAFYPPNDRDGRTARAILHTVEAALTAMPDGVPML